MEIEIVVSVTDEGITKDDALCITGDYNACEEMSYGIGMAVKRMIDTLMGEVCGRWAAVDETKNSRELPY